MPNKQVGHQLRRDATPHFAGFTVRGDSWKEREVTKATMNEDGDQEIFNVSMSGPGFEATCDGFPDAGFEFRTGDVLSEIDTDTPRSWVVTDPGTKGGFGTGGTVYTGVKLYTSDALDTTQVS